jgi:Mrp family chromosome partitioning ATPase
VAANLAIAAARTGEQTLLLDLSSTGPALAKRLVMSGDLGLRDALSRESRPIECVKSSPVLNLSLLAVNDGDGSQVLSVDGNRVYGLIQSLEQHFDFIVVDLPATDTGLCIATVGTLDGVLIVLESEVTHSEAAHRATQRLIDANAKLLGIILNKHHRHVPAWLDRRL